MNLDEDIASILARIAKAESDQGRWRSSGNREKYLDSYFLVETLEIELGLLRKQRLEAAAKPAQLQAANTPPDPTPKASLS